MIKIDDETYSASLNLETNIPDDQIEWSIDSEQATIEADGMMTCGEIGENTVITAKYNPEDTVNVLIAHAKIIYFNGETGDKEVTNPLPQNGTPTPFHVLPGQRNYLRIQLEPNDGELVSVVWEILTRAVADYRSTPGQGNVIELQQGDLNKDTVAFYWVDGGEKLVSATVKVKFNGKELEFKRTATFQVDRPEIAFTLSQKKSHLDLNLLADGRSRSVTRHYTVFNRANNPVKGTCAWTQLISFSAALEPGSKGYAVQGVDFKPTNPDAQGVDDDGNPVLLTWNDEPKWTGVNPTDISYNISRDFETWLMYNSDTPGSIWIPLAKKAWLTRANVIWNGNKWIEVDIQPTIRDGILIPVKPSSPTTDFPVWDKQVTIEGIKKELGITDE